MKTSRNHLPPMEHSQPIRNRVMATVCNTLTIETIPFEEDLMDSGLLDSLSLIQLMVALEEEFDIRLEPEMMDFTDYRSVRSITEMIKGLTFSSARDIRASG